MQPLTLARLPVWLVLGAAWVAVGCGTPGEAPTTETDEVDTSITHVSCATASPGRDAAVCDLLSELRGSHDLPGISAAVRVADEVLVTYVLGWADVESRTPMSPESRMLAGSIGKTFVAALAVSLAAEGTVDLEEPIAKWVGEEDWFRRLPFGDRLTLRNLLTHRSGIGAHFDQRFAEEVLPRFLDRSYRFEPTDLFLTLPTPEHGPPGDELRYTDIAFDVAAVVLARAAGEPYFDQVERRFLEPLGLTATEPQDGWSFDGLAQGYMPRGFLESQPDWAVSMFESILDFQGDEGRMLRDGELLMNPVSEFGGGGFVSNPSDLTRWARVHFGGGLLEEPYLDEVTRDPAPDPFPTPDPEGRARSQSYGLGAWIMETDDGRGFGHGGYFPGYLSSLIYFEASEIAVALQTNRVADVDLSLPSIEIVEIFEREIP